MKRFQQGVTLIELMVAQLLGLLVINGALAVFAPGISLFGQTNGAAFVQEAGRLAMETIVSDIEQSGYRGCAPENRMMSVIDAASPVVSRRLTRWAFERFSVSGVDADDAGGVDLLLGSGWNSRRFTQGTHRYGDVLLVQSVRPGDLVLAAHDPEREQLVFAGDQRSMLRAGMVIGISDCRQSTLLQLDRDTVPVYEPGSDLTMAGYGAAASVNCAAPSSGNDYRVWLGGDSEAGCGDTASRLRLEPYRFGSGSKVFGLASRLYYLSVQDQTEYPSLYRTEMAADGVRLNTEIIAEGVENMRLRYGIDGDNDGVPERYVSAATLGAAISGSWNDVVSVRLWLMVSSVEQRGHSRFHQPVLFPDEAGSMEQCVTPGAIPSSACPLTSQPFPNRKVFSRDVMLRNAGT